MLRKTVKLKMSVLTGYSFQAPTEYGEDEYKGGHTAFFIIGNLAEAWKYPDL